jgi:hypothetical protein
MEQQGIRTTAIPPPSEYAMRTPGLNPDRSPRQLLRRAAVVSPQDRSRGVTLSHSSHQAPIRSARSSRARASVKVAT